MIAVLHNIRSLHNVGSMFRTADAAGIEKIYLCGYTSAPVDESGMPRPQISKTALGAETTVPWEKKKSVTALLDRLHRDGSKIYAVEIDQRAVLYHKLKLSPRALKKAVIVVGNEVAGVPPAVLKRADKILQIPMHGKKESLNVSVAFGIIAYALRTRMKKRPANPRLSLEEIDRG